MCVFASTSWMSSRPMHIVVWWWNPGTRTCRDGESFGSLTGWASSSSSEDDTAMSLLLGRDASNIEGDLTRVSDPPRARPLWFALLYTRVALWKFFLLMDARRMDLEGGGGGLGPLSPTSSPAHSPHEGLGREGPPPLVVPSTPWRQGGLERVPSGHLR